MLYFWQICGKYHIQLAAARLRKFGATKICFKIALDEGAPEDIAFHLPGHNVQSVRQLSLKGTKNGKLPAAIEAGGFDALVGNDKRLEFDLHVSRWPFAVLLLSTNHWPTVKPNVANIEKALETARPGTITRVDCGRFVPLKLRSMI